MKKQKIFKMAPEHRWRQAGKFERNCKKIKEYEGTYLPMHSHGSCRWDDEDDRGWRVAHRIYNYLDRWIEKQVGRKTSDVFRDFKKLINWKSDKTMYVFWDRYYSKPTDHSIDRYMAKWWKNCYTSDEDGNFIDIKSLDIPYYTEEEEQYADHNRRMMKKIPDHGEIYIDQGSGWRVRKKYPENEYYIGRFYVVMPDGSYKLKDVFHVIDEHQRPDGFVRVDKPIGVEYNDWSQFHKKRVKIWEYDYHNHEEIWTYDWKNYGIGKFNAFVKV